MDEFQNQNIAWKKPDTKKLQTDFSIHVNFEIRTDWYMVLKVRILIIFLWDVKWVHKNF